MEEETITSSDTLRGNRVPPGQHLVDHLPVLHYSKVPKIEIADWRLAVSGLVARPVALTYGEFQALPSSKVFCDIHCVTTWSTLGHTWTGVRTVSLRNVADVLPAAKFVTVKSYDGYTTNLPLDEFFDDDVILATGLDGKELSKDYGWPARLVVPRLYFWKSAKWVSGIEFMERDRPGFWETRGYHNHGDPWKEERYG